MLESILPIFFSIFSSSTPYDVIVSRLEKIAGQYPQQTQIIEIGKSDQGIPILGLQIGKGSIKNLVVGTHHGNEYGSTAVAMAMAEATAAHPISSQTLFVIPVLNISGYNSNSRYERGPRGQSFDPNRDYEGPCVREPSFQLKSTKALAEFIEKQNVISIATLHTYMPGVLYPWGFSTRETRTEDESEFIDLARQATLESRYEIGNSTEALYAADGTFEDYSYWKHGTWSLLFELGRSHQPNQSETLEMIKQNVPGLRRFFESSPNEKSSKHQFSGRCDYSVQKRTKLE